ncbi:hypothetical protein H632_c1718p1 [Helicosporidium sp. ATCC 50920]|nr:hypothetical protein H632_c1718p1 [Helicosporidium sp. ATCC 50920]|eukprot:KDD73933.1 hypothetical protein H632_c1718p1 [Helicosporidium sp. ATCC 50920]
MKSSGVELYRYAGMERATLLRRYKRFLGDVKPAEQLEAGQAVAAVETVHVPNTGPMTGLLDNLPAPAVLSRSTAASRKYPCTLEWLRPAPAAPWVGVHSARANALARVLLEKHLLSGLGTYDRVRSEVAYGAGSRVDFVLERSAEEGSSAGSSAGGPEGGSEEGAEGSKNTAVSTAATLPLYLEVKSVTLAETLSGAALRDQYVAVEDGEFEIQAKASGASAPRLLPGSSSTTVGLFPDTVSLRARKHVEALTRLAAGRGARAALLFLAQRGDCQAVAPCFAADPRYASLVSAAARGGVLLLGAAVGLDEREGVVRFVRQVPVLLPRAAAGWAPPVRGKTRRGEEATKPFALALDDGEVEGRRKKTRSAADLETFRFRRKT